MAKMSPSHTNSFSPKKISSPSSNSKRPLQNMDNEDNSNENDNISFKRKKSCSLSQEDINEAVQTTTEGYMTRHRLLKQLKENNKSKTSQVSVIPFNRIATKSKKTSKKKNNNFQKNKKVIPGYVFTNDIVFSPLNCKRIKTNKNSTPSLFESGSESENEELQSSATTSNPVDKANVSILVSDCASTFTKDGGMKKYYNKKPTFKFNKTNNYNMQLSKNNKLSNEKDMDVSFCQKKSPAQVFRLISGDDPSFKSMNLDNISTLSSNSSECPVSGENSPQYLLVNNIKAKKIMLEKNTIKSPQVIVNNESSCSTSPQKSIFDMPLTPASVIESIGTDDGSNESINSQHTNDRNVEILNSCLINSQQRNIDAGQDNFKINNTPVPQIHFDFSGFVATKLPQININDQTNEADNNFISKSILLSQTPTNANIISSCKNEKVQSTLPDKTKCDCKTNFDLNIICNKILNTKSKHFVFDINTQKARDKFHHQKLAEDNVLQSLITSDKRSMIRLRNNIINKGVLVKAKPIPKCINETLEVTLKTLKEDHIEPIIMNISNKTLEVVPKTSKRDYTKTTSAKSISNETVEVFPKTSKKDHIEPIIARILNETFEVPKKSKINLAEPILKSNSNKTVIPNNINEDHIEHIIVNISNETSEVVPKSSKKDHLEPIVACISNKTLEVLKKSKINLTEPIIKSNSNKTVIPNNINEDRIEHIMNISNETLGVPNTFHIEPDIMSILNEAYVDIDYHSDSCEFLNKIFDEKVNDDTTIRNSFKLDTFLPTKTDESEIKSENTNGYQLNSKKNESIEMNDVNDIFNKSPKSSTLKLGVNFTEDSPVKYEKNQSLWSLKTNLVSEEELNIASEKEVEHKKTHFNKYYMTSKSITSPNKSFLASPLKKETSKSPIQLSSNQFHCGSSPLKSVLEQSKTTSYINNEWFSDSETSFDDESTQTTSNNVVPVSIYNGKNINSDNSTITTANDKNNSIAWQVSSNELFNSNSGNSKTNTLSPKSQQILKDEQNSLKSHFDTLASKVSTLSKKLSNDHTSCITKLHDSILELSKDTPTRFSDFEQYNANEMTQKTLAPSTNVCDSLYNEKKSNYKKCSTTKTSPGYNGKSKLLFGLIQNGLPSLESQFEQNTSTKTIDKVHCETNNMDISTVDIPQPSIFNLNFHNDSLAIDNGTYDDGKVLIHYNNSTDNDSSDDEGKLQIECDLDNYSDKNSKTLDSSQKCGSNSTLSENINKKVLESKNMILMFNKENDSVANLNFPQENNNELSLLNNFDTNNKDMASPTTIFEFKEDQQSSTKVPLNYMSPNLTVHMCNELFLKEYSNDKSSFPKNIQDIFTEMLVGVPYVPMCYHLTVPECDNVELTSDNIANTKTNDININDMPVEISNVEIKDDVGESFEKFNESNKTICEVKMPKKKKKKNKKKKNTALQKKHIPKSNVKIRCNLREFVNSDKPINEIVESKEFRNLRFFNEEDIACTVGVFLFENGLGTPVIYGLEPYKVDYSQLDDSKKIEQLRNTNLHINCPKIVRLTLLTLALAKMIRKDSLIHKILNVIRKNLLNKKLNTNHQVDHMIITQTTYFVDICVRLRLLKTLQMFMFDSMVLLPNKYCCVIFVSLLMWKNCLPRKLNNQQDPVLVPILSCLIAKQKFYSEQHIGPDIYQRELINLLSFHFNYSFSTELPVNFMQHINKPDFFVSIVLFLKCCNPKDKIEFIVNCLFPVIENYLNTQQNEGNALKTMRTLIISIPPFKTSCNTIVASYVNKYKRLVYPNKDCKEHINITMYNCYKTLQEKFLSYFNDNRNRSRLFEESLVTIIMVLGSVDYATSTLALMKWKPKYKLSALLLQKITIFKSVLGSELWDKLCDMDDYNMVNCIINSSLLKNKNIYKVITQVHAIQ